MYVGRIVAVGRTRRGAVTAMYRVSSRSFPNRQARILEKAVAILPKAGYEKDIERNPYIAYNCLRLAGDCAVAANGSHTDPIADKIDGGMGIRDALASVLLAMDYERDAYNTPRIAAVVRHGARSGFLGIVRHDALLVREFPLEPGTAFYVCTYEQNVPDPRYTDPAFEAESATDACRVILGAGAFKDLERPITAACALAQNDGTFEVAIADAQPPKR
ncbi:MAG: IMP cyclohydrolase [Kiritimatiellaeota bacterium]|nr:IMP cyclohydrolase [Kiritimatiellota bacterium]